MASVSVGVAQNQTAERQQAYVAEKQMGGELVLDKDGAACKACKAYKATHASYVVVADANGIVVYSGVEAEQDIDSAIQKALSAMQHSM